MTQWECRVSKIKVDDLDAHLNHVGSQGWEVVTVALDERVTWLVVLKRPLARMERR